MNANQSEKCSLSLRFWLRSFRLPVLSVRDMVSLMKSMMTVAFAGSAFTALLMIAIACCGADGASPPVDRETRYLFYLHGKIVEDLGERPKSAQFGYYEYRKILAALRDKGFTVKSEVRPKNTNPKKYAEKIANEIRRLQKQGVPSPRITVVGASKGGVIAVYVSNLLKDKGLNFVIHDEADASPIVPDRFFERSEGLGRHRAVTTHLGLGHGLVYRPYPEWVDPLVDWVK